MSIALSGSLELSGSIIISGSISSTGGITISGSIASASYAANALSASYWSGSIQNAASASYVLNAISSSFATTASYATSTLRSSTVSISGISTNAEYTFPLIATGSSGPSIGLNIDTATGIVYNPSTDLFRVTNLTATGSLSGTSSFANNTTTASYATNALSASYAPAVSSFPYTGSAIITGSLSVTGSTFITGNVGIGTTSPIEKLDVTKNGNQSDVNWGSIMVRNTANYAVGNDASIGFALNNSGNTNCDPRASIGCKTESDLGGALVFNTRLNAGTYTEKMRVNGGGNVGIGTTNPDFASSGDRVLTISGSATRARINLQNSSTSTSGVAGSVAGYNGATFLTSMDMIADGATNTGAFVFYTANAGSTGERFRVNSSGTSTTGAITATGDITAYSSDKRLKENTINIPNALDKVLSLNGITYDWNKKALDFGFVPDRLKHDVGLIAQEVQSILPEAIAPAPFDTNTTTGESISGENYLTVRYDKLVPLLIEAIKEQQIQINELKVLLNK